MKVFVQWIRKEPVLFAAILLAGCSACVVPPDIEYLGYIDNRVLALLFCLMLVVTGLQEAGVFQAVSRKLLQHVHGLRGLVWTLLALCFFGSMVITNDVSLITFVPFAILILTMTGMERYLIPVIVLQTIGANLGSMLTPVGNPQNLYLYSVAGMSITHFLQVMAVPTVISFAMLVVSGFFFPNHRIALKESAAETLNKQKIGIYLILLVVCLLTVAHFLHYLVTLLLVVAIFLLINRQLFARVDYVLLATFAAFFVFVGNVERVSAVNQLLTQAVGGNELGIGIVLSQFISNVPAAILLSGFTTQYEALLLGVNIGGLGTLIASMASLISYKCYTGLEPQKSVHKGKYMLVFTGLNLLFLAVLVLAVIVCGMQ